ncbi:MAG: hypothetical protein JSU96_14385, partial [Acidobacteriota bacterium]
CPDDCTEGYVEGTQVTLAAEPADGSSFQGWLGGDDCSTEQVCRVTMTEKTTVWATFKLIQPPTVALVQPDHGSLVKGTVPVQATASDDEEIAQVRFLVDGTKQLDLVQPPFVFLWDTATVANGVHTLEARAFDNYGKTASESVTVTVQNQLALTVNRFGRGDGKVTSSPSGIDCGQDCVGIFNPGTSVTLTANPAAGASFGGWSGACSGYGSCVVALSSAQYVHAKFNSLADSGWSQGISYDHDSTGQLVAVNYDDGRMISYTYDGAGNLVERSLQVPLSKLYFPFYQTRTGTFLGIAVSNYSAEAANIEFEAFGPGGQTLSLGKNPSAFLIPAQNQLAKTAAEIFSAPQQNQSAWIELRSENAELGSFFQFGDSTLTQLDGSIALDRHYRELYLTRVYEGESGFRGEKAKTFLSLANPTDGPVTVRLSLHTLDGASDNESYRSASAEVSQTLPAKGFVYDSVAGIFGEPQVSGGYVKIVVIEGQGVVAFELIELPNRRTVIGLGASPGNMGGELYSAQLADASSIYTDLKLINVSDQVRNVRITPVGGTGAALRPYQTLLMEVGQQVEVDMGTFFGFSTPSELTVGSIRVETDGPGVVGDVLFGDPIGFKYAASMPLQTEKVTRAVFSQVATTLDFFTGLALYNPDTEETEITINVYNASGQRKGSAIKLLAAGHRMAGLIPELVPSAATVVGGYIVVESTRPLVAQQIFGQAQLNQFSAVPPKIVE